MSAAPSTGSGAPSPGSAEEMPDDLKQFDEQQSAADQAGKQPVVEENAAVEKCPPAYRFVVNLLRRAVSVPFEGIGAWCRRRWNDTKAPERWALKKDSDEARDLGDLAALWVNTRVRIDPNNSPGFFLLVAVLAALLVRACEQGLYVLALAWAEDKADGKDKA